VRRETADGLGYIICRLRGIIHAYDATNSAASSQNVRKWYFAAPLVSGFLLHTSLPLVVCVSFTGGVWIAGIVGGRLSNQTSQPVLHEFWDLERKSDRNVLWVVSGYVALLARFMQLLVVSFLRFPGICTRMLCTVGERRKM
jgi:hypothetical protein